MKQLLFLLLITVTFQASAQQTEDDIYVGKSRTYGNYKGTDIRTSNQVKGQVIITGTVLKVDQCELNCLTVWVKKNDGSTVSVGTRDHGFSIPKNTIGKRIIVEGIDPAEKKTVKKTYQKDIQIMATGIRIFY